MKIAYVAGPFRAPNYWQQEQNIRRAEAIAWELWRMGFAVVCPHTNTRFYQGSLPDAVWLVGDLEIMRRCDCVVMTPDWINSSGARAEHDEAEQHELPVFIWPEHRETIQYFAGHDEDI